jgi:hypothetical protein
MRRWKSRASARRAIGVSASSAGSPFNIGAKRDWDEVRRDLTDLLELKGDTGGLTRLEELLARLS